MHDIWNEIYDLLVQRGGASEIMREAFVHSHIMERNRKPTEWKIGGKLGNGGKFYHDHKSFNVDMYQEDETPERLELKYQLNSLLKPLYIRWVEARYKPKVEVVQVVDILDALRWLEISGKYPGARTEYENCFESWEMEQMDNGSYSRIRKDRKSDGVILALFEEFDLDEEFLAYTTY